jgi:hypothetical protein
MSTSKSYDQAEVDRIEKAKETNEKLEIFFENKRKDWNNKVKPIFEVLKLDPTNPGNSKKLLDYQSMALVYRQDINDQINLFLNKRSKESVKLKGLKQEKFIFYATGFGIKTNLGEKGILIDGHIAQNQRTMELIESYIQFLRDTVKNIESFGYSIKNIIELLNYLGSQ